MASRQRLKRPHGSLLAALVVCLATVTCTASDLSDSIQRFFQGDYEGARQGLSRSIDEGQADARAYYFRGVASYRLGDAEAATADFEAGAQLEAGGQGKGIGRALQRIQGMERLQLEKHRRLARLKARQRSQPTAPRPLGRRQVGRTGGEVVGLTQGLRLASEVPLSVRSSAPDPFVDEPGEDLVRTSAPTVKSIDAQDQPVGTGVASASNTAGPIGGEDDPFGDFDAPEPGARVLPASNATASEGRNTFRMFGAVVRALGKATVPQVDPRSLIPSALGGGGPDENEPASGEFEGDLFEGELRPFEHHDGQRR